MNRLNQLIRHHNAGSINESDYHELVELFIKTLNEQGEMTNFYGEQLMELKAANALLSQKIIIQKVN